MENRLVSIGPYEERGSTLSELKRAILEEDLSEILADTLFKIFKNIKGDGPGFVSIPESQATAVRAELRRLILMTDEASPLTEIYDQLYKRIGEADRRR